MRCPECGNEERFWVKERMVNWVLLDNETEEVVKEGEVEENRYEQDAFQCGACEKVFQNSWSNWATRNQFNEEKYRLLQNGKVLFTGPAPDVREKIEELLREKFGFFISLRESTEIGEFQFFLHEDNDTNLTEKQEELLRDHYGIDTMNEESSEREILNLLNIKIEKGEI